MERNTIESELLIRLVKVRPVLWDKWSEIYKDKRRTFEAWREIFTILKTDFEEMSPTQKNEYGKSVIKNWTNLRDRWMKCHKRLKEMKPGTKKVRKCDYYDEMLFLTKILTHPDSDSNIPVTSKNDEKNPLTEPPIGTPPKKRKQNESEEHNNSQCVKTIHNEDESRALSFFKSIAPSVDKFSDIEMIDFQYEVIKLVRTITKERQNNIAHRWNTEYFLTTQHSYNVPGPSYPCQSTEPAPSERDNTASVPLSNSSMDSTHTDELDFSIDVEEIEPRMFEKIRVKKDLH